MIGLLALWIAYQQWKTNDQKFKLDLYERRLRIYEEVKKFILAVVGQYEFNMETLFRFGDSTSEADFLFSMETRKYIEELFQHGLKYLKWRGQYRDVHSPAPVPSGYDHLAVVNGIKNELEWFSAQSPIVRDLFKKEMKVGN